MTRGKIVFADTGCYDVSNNWTDYIYFVNASGHDMKAITGKVVLRYLHLLQQQIFTENLDMIIRMEPWLEVM